MTARRADGTARDDPALARAGALLEIDLTAIQANYRRLCQELKGVAAGPSVKADAYGLGAAQVVPALAEAGARTFFVALPDEAIALRQALKPVCPEAAIYVLNGLMPGAERDYLAHDVRPVLNQLDEIARWRELAAKGKRALPAALHIDTGMNRLGLSAAELSELSDGPERLEGIAIDFQMSHLACAEEADNPMNPRQLEAFRAACARLPAAPASLANSSGIFLGPDYHFDLARPGAALYGVNPTPAASNPMAQVIRLRAKILQIREIDAPQSVGYGAAHRVGGPTRLATVGVGYADGYLRSLSDRGSAFIGGEEVAVVGRVSMDLITLDVTGVAPDEARPGAWVDLIDPRQGPDRLAEEAGTIGYEILTALGRRYHRVYL